MAHHGGRAAISHPRRPILSFSLLKEILLYLYDSASMKNGVVLRMDIKKFTDKAHFVQLPRVLATHRRSRPLSWLLPLLVLNTIKISSLVLLGDFV